MNLEGLLTQALKAADEAVKSDLGQSVKSQLEKGVATAAAMSQNLPKQEEIAQIIEERSPALAQTFLSYASEVSNPHQVGMGLKVLKLDDLSVRAQLPHRWRNRTQNGSLHSAALQALAEFTARTFWERQVDRGLAEMQLLEIQAQIHSESFRPVSAQFNVSGEEREKILFELRKEGEVQFETPVIVFGKGDTRVADFNLLWKMSTPMTLSAPEPASQEES